MKKRDDRRNFTLMEMLVVMGLIALIASMIGGGYIYYLRSSRPQAAAGIIKNIELSLGKFYQDMNRFPDPAVGLDELMENVSNDENWKGPYFEAYELPKDPWGRDFIYTIQENGRYLITSYGEDGVEGGTGLNADITNLGIKKQ